MLPYPGTLKKKTRHNVSILPDGRKQLSSVTLKIAKGRDPLVVC